MWDNNNYTIKKKQPNSQIEGISVIKKQNHQHSSVANALNNHFCDVASDVGNVPALIQPPLQIIFNPEYKKKFSFSQLINEVQVFLLLSRKPRQK